MAKHWNSHVNVLNLKAAGQNFLTRCAKQLSSCVQIQMVDVFRLEDRKVKELKALP